MVVEGALAQGIIGRGATKVLKGALMNLSWRIVEEWL